MTSRRGLPNGDLRVTSSGDVRVLPGFVEQTTVLVIATLRIGQQRRVTQRIGRQAKQTLRI